MSATLSETIESLHIAAARKLTELIQTEKDPSLLARLIATAFRFKLPKPAKDAPTHRPPSQTPYPNRARQEADRRVDHAPNLQAVAPVDPRGPTSPRASDAPIAPGIVPAGESPRPITPDHVNRHGPADADSTRERPFKPIAPLSGHRAGPATVTG